MTIANIVTISRIAMIPCFVLAVMYYAASVKKGAPMEWLHWTAISLFATAAATDALDGYLARKLNAKTRLGSILDPIADKTLVLTALLLLSWNHGDAFDQLPLWFPIVILSRDAIVVLGVTVVFVMGRGFDVHPHWIGKTATVLQMIVIGMVLLNVPVHYWNIPLWITGLLTVISGIIYVNQGTKKLA